MANITGQNELSENQEKILMWLSQRPERGFFGPQKHIAEGIGGSRAHTNVLIKDLQRKGLLYVYRNLGINQKLTFVTVDPLTKERAVEAVVGVTNG